MTTKQQVRQWAADSVAYFPLFAYGFLMLFAWLAYRQEGRWPVFAQPDPSYVGIFHPGDGIGHLMLIFIGWVAIPGSIAALIMTIVHSWGRLVKSNWAPELRQSLWLGARILVCFAGMILFWSQLLILETWLRD